MKRKIIISVLMVLALTSAFLIGKHAPSKYDYLDLQAVSETQIENNEVLIYTTTGDYYSFELSNANKR